MVWDLKGKLDSVTIMTPVELLDPVIYFRFHTYTVKEKEKKIKSFNRESVKLRDPEWKTRSRRRCQAGRKES